MYISVALMMDHKTDEWVHGMAMKLHESYGINMDARKLGAHVSLKLVYQMADLRGTYELLENLSKKLTVFDVTYDSIAHIQGDYHILWLNVVETMALREIHDLLNDRLPVPLGVYDGPNFHFHSTIAIGQEEAFKQVDLVLEEAHLAQAVALVVSTSDTGGVGTFQEVKSFNLRTNEIKA